MNPSDTVQAPVPPQQTGRRLWPALAVLLLLGAALRGLAIDNSSQTAVGNMPLPDDAFYYFVLARNVAAGEGLVISGEGTPTTGFQPLWGMILSAIDSLTGGMDDGDRILSAQVLGSLFGLATALLIFLSARRLSPNPLSALLACGAFLLSPQVVKHNLNGMETSLALLALISLLTVFLIYDPRRSAPGTALLVGLLCGLCILARVDLAIVVAAGFGAWVLAALAPAKSEAERDRKTIWARIGLAGAGVSVALLPWVWIARNAGAGLLPESGAAVRNLTLLLHDLPLMGFAESLRQAREIFLPQYFEYAVEFTSAWVRQVPILLPATIPVFALLELKAAEAVSAVLAVLVTLGLLVFAARSRHRMLRLAVGLWLVYALAMTLAYSGIVLGPWFFQRYGAPIAVWLHLLLLVALGLRLGAARGAPAGAALAAVGIALGFVALVWQGSYRWIAQGERAVPDDGFYRAAQAIDRELPADARVGAFSAGLITYYVRQPVVALDGKVNGGARRAMVDGAMFRYICEVGVDYIADWEKMVDRLLVHRSGAWSEDNLRLLQVIDVEDGNDILIFEVNDQACPS